MHSMKRKAIKKSSRNEVKFLNLKKKKKSVFSYLVIPLFGLNHSPLDPSCPPELKNPLQGAYLRT